MVEQKYKPGNMVPEGSVADFLEKTVAHSNKKDIDAHIGT